MCIAVSVHHSLRAGSRTAWGMCLRRGTSWQGASGSIHAYLRCLNANESVSIDDGNNSSLFSTETFLFPSRARIGGKRARPTRRPS